MSETNGQTKPAWKPDLKIHDNYITLYGQRIDRKQSDVQSWHVFWQHYYKHLEKLGDPEQLIERRRNYWRDDLDLMRRLLDS